MRRLVHGWAVAVCAGSALLFGCSKPDEKPAGGDKPLVEGKDHKDGEKGHDEHAHGKGPHGGEVAELGSESDGAHAEIVHNEETGVLTIYLLDESAEKPLFSEATELVINAKVDGKGVQHKLAAKAGEKDPAGKTSSFETTDKVVGELLEAEGSEPEMVVIVEGKELRGAIEHHH